MPDYTLTAANVQPSIAAVRSVRIAGATILAGQPLYFDSADLDTDGRAKAKPADANASAATASVQAIAGNSAASGQRVDCIESDSDFTHGLTTVAAGDIIILSATAGAQCPSADLGSGHFPVVLQVAKSATKSVLRITAGTVAKS